MPLIRLVKDPALLLPATFSEGAILDVLYFATRDSPDELRFPGEHRRSAEMHTQKQRDASHASLNYPLESSIPFPLSREKKRRRFKHPSSFDEAIKPFKNVLSIGCRIFTEKISSSFRVSTTSSFVLGRILPFLRAGPRILGPKNEPRLSDNAAS